MQYLSGTAAQKAQSYLDQAAQIAQKATCQRSKCGSIIVQNGQIIGQGYNTPPADLESQRKCLANKDSYHRKVTDKTCCLHAEQRAIFDALRHHPQQLTGATLYFIRLDEQNQAQPAGQPYCTICSKMALDTGVKSFILWHQQGIAVYDTAEYNLLSYQYQE